MGNGMMMTAVAVLALTGCEQHAAKMERTAAVEEATAPEPTTTFYSVGNARDGDDIEFSVRMWGFDTPERGASCVDPNASPPEQRINVWNRSREALDAIINDRTGGELRHRRIDCVMKGHDRQDERLVAQCSVDGTDIGEQMVEQGWARDWPEFSGGYYRNAQNEAQRLRHGIWGICDDGDDVWGDRDYSVPQGAAGRSQ